MYFLKNLQKVPRKYIPWQADMKISPVDEYWPQNALPPNLSMTECLFGKYLGRCKAVEII